VSNIAFVFLIVISTLMASLAGWRRSQIFRCRVSPHGPWGFVGVIRTAFAVSTVLLLGLRLWYLGIAVLFWLLIVSSLTYVISEMRKRGPRCSDPGWSPCRPWIEFWGDFFEVALLLKQPKVPLFWSSVLGLCCTLAIFALGSSLQVEPHQSPSTAPRDNSLHIAGTANLTDMRLNTKQETSISDRGGANGSSDSRRNLGDYYTRMKGGFTAGVIIGIALLLASLMPSVFVDFSPSSAHDAVQVRHVSDHKSLGEMFSYLVTGLILCVCAGAVGAVIAGFMEVYASLQN
jgi:hypothetical protein